MPPETILEQLAWHTAAGDAQPEVDVYLASGPVLRGRVVAVHDGTATLQIGTPSQPATAYVRVAQVAAVVVHGAVPRARMVAPSVAPGVVVGAPGALGAGDPGGSIGAPAGAVAPTPLTSDDVPTPVTPMTLDELKAAHAARIARDPARGTPDRNPAAHEAVTAPARTPSPAVIPREALAARTAAGARTTPVATDAAPPTTVSAVARRPARDDVSAAFDAMRVDATGTASPVSDPVAEFVASQYDVITPPDPIEPPSLELAPPPMHLEAPTFLGGVGPRGPVRADRDERGGRAPRDAHALRGARAERAPREPASDAREPAHDEGPRPRAAPSDHTPTPRPRTPAPSRVDLMRQANTHAELMSRVLRHRVDIFIAAPLDDDARRAIAHALPLASDVLLALIGSPEHPPALDALTSVKLVAGDPEVVRDGTRLVIRCSVVDKYTAASLRAAIERA